jgi:riboflavin synthase
MFTGIVEEAGRIKDLHAGKNSIRMKVRASICADGVRAGDSVAVNGCCLTVTEFSADGELTFDLLKETWDRTNFQQAKSGSLVNLERSMPADGRVHGHFVTGHIDGAGRIEVFEQRGSDWYLRVAPPRELMRYVVMKGAIAVDGMSLTVAEVAADAFAIWIIPHTLRVTALRERKAGDLVNIEADLLAKYVERLTRPA